MLQRTGVPSRYHVLQRGVGVFVPKQGASSRQAAGMAVRRMERNALRETESVFA